MVKKRFSKSLFFPPKDKALARKISIRTPGEFRKSIATLKKGGITRKENRALRLGRTRAMVQLKRPNLSLKERGEFLMIAKMKIPKVTRK